MRANKITQGFSDSSYQAMIHKGAGITDFLTTMHAAIPVKDLDNVALLKDFGVDDFRGRILDSFSDQLLMKTGTVYRYPNGSVIKNVRYPGFANAKLILDLLNGLIRAFQKSPEIYKSTHKDQFLSFSSAIISTSHPFIDANGRLARRAIKYLSDSVYGESIDLENVNYQSLIPHYRLFTLYALPSPENPLSRKGNEINQYDLDEYSKEEKINFANRYSQSTCVIIDQVSRNISSGAPLLQGLAPEIQQCLNGLSNDYRQKI